MQYISQNKSQKNYKSPKVDRAKSKKNDKKVHFDDNIVYHTYDKNTATSDLLSEIFSDNKENIDVDKIFSSIASSDCSDSIKKIHPSNQNIDSEKVWDANFGLPLMTSEEKQKYVTKIQKNYKEYEKSLGKFVKYQTDDNTVTKPDTINPFDPNQANIFKDKTIKEIYDKQVEGPRAKPKKVKYTTPYSIEYED